MIRQYVLTTADVDLWHQFLPAEACVMGSLEYARIIEGQSGFSGRLFVVKSGETVFAYPFFIRPVNDLPFAAGASKARWDTFTPEYTGPLCLRTRGLRGAEVTTFADRFAWYCGENGIIAEFAHLSPWHQSEQLLDPALVLPDRDVVQVDLTLGETNLWTKSLNSDARRMTRQAEKSGVRVRWAETLDDVRAFHQLHAATMERRQALERYRLPEEYFADIFETMPDNAFIALAEYRNQVVAGGLFFHGGPDVYWHLSAADLEFSRLRAVNKYVWETIRWAVKAGKRRMLLGGGYQPNDGVFRFKAGFSPLRVRFSTYRRIHDENAYRSLATAWSVHYGADFSGAGFFPVYRSPHPHEQTKLEAVSG